MAVRPLSTAAEEFFAGESVSFASLGLQPAVCEALEHAGYPKPAAVQELAAAAILQRRDVVLAAETGSGKTLAYLAPLASLALQGRAEQEAMQQQQQLLLQQQEERSGEWLPEATAPRRQRSTGTLVLCPNAALCEQVVAAAGRLVDPATGAPVVRAAMVSAQCPPPFELPDIVVMTPGALVSVMDNVGPAYGFEWTRAGLPTWARSVVFDEADLLLAGGYGAQMRIILEVLRLGHREHTARRICVELGLSLEQFEGLPRHLRVAALRGGAAALRDAGVRLPPKAAAPAAAAAEGGEPELASLPNWQRQYIFVGATMPTEGDHTVGAELLRRFPDAAWLAGQQLHQSKRSMQHHWRRVEDEQHREEVLQDLILQDPLLSQGKGRMVVFTQDVATADATAAALREGLGRAQRAAAAAAGGSSRSSRAAPPVLLYHKGVPAEQRAAALARVAGEEGAVLVCTDAAARGLDLPGVSHVVQADFAASAIDFLHRVGRTARAGLEGVVTSLYYPEAEPLVDAIRDNINAGLPVEGAFSRKRSFSKKFKKYGQYVPRGKEGPNPGGQPQRERPHRQRAGR